LFGHKQNLNEIEFRNEIFLNLNILSRPAGPDSNKKGLNKNLNRSMKKSNGFDQKKLSLNNVVNLPQKEKLDPIRTIGNKQKSKV